MATSANVLFCGLIRLEPPLLLKPMNMAVQIIWRLSHFIILFTPKKLSLGKNTYRGLGGGLNLFVLVNEYIYFVFDVFVGQ